MGFEQDYEKVLKDGTWGKALRGVVSGEGMDTFPGILDRAICKELRGGKYAGVREIAMAFKDHYQQAQILDRLRLPLDVFAAGTDELVILRRFESMSADFLRRFGGTELADNFRGRAMEKLCDHCIPRPGDHERFVLSPEAATVSVVVEFLADRIEKILEPAVPIARKRRGESREAVKDRLQTSIRAANLERHANFLMQGCHDKARAAHRRRPRVVETVRYSLIGKGPGI
jgi:hypothetical protein